MSLGRARERISTSVDWINISYRAVYLFAGIGLAIVLALALGLVYRESVYDLLSPARRDARVEIAEAARLLAAAAPYAGETRTAELGSNARTKLQESEGQYGQRNYRDARTSAIVSQNYSQKLIDMSRGESTTSREVRFYRIEGEVRVKRSGQFHWEDATSKMLLRMGDQIKTGSNAGAQIIYFDGTITTVRADSLLEIKDLYEEPVSRQRRVSEKLNWGELETSTRKANVAGSYHEIQSVSATARSREDSAFRVVYDQTKDQGSFALYSGKVDISTKQAQTTIKSGETVAIDRGVLGNVEKLPPAPRLFAPTDQKIIVYGNPSTASTTLAWEQVPEAAVYRLQLSQRSLFGSLLIDKRDVRASAVELPKLPAEGYYWRVASIDAAGRSSPFSPSRKFRIQTTDMRERGDKTPPVLALQDFIQNGPYVILNGKTEAGAMLWVEGERIDVDDEGVFYAVVRLKKEGRNKVQVVSQDPSGNETRKSLEAYVESY